MINVVKHVERAVAALEIESDGEVLYCGVKIQELEFLAKSDADMMV